MNMSVSLIVTTFNDHQYLRQNIASILDQTVRVAEVVLVDDGSEDGGAVIDLVAEFDRQGNPPIHLVRIDNAGPSVARNLGLSRAQSPFVVFLDADDWLEPRHVELKLEAMRHATDAHFGVYGSFVDSDGSAHRFRNFSGVPAPEMIGRVITGIPGSSAAYLFRAEAVRAVGAYDAALRNNEDFDLLIRLAQRGLHCTGDCGSVFFRRVREVSQSKPGDPRQVVTRLTAFLSKAEALGYFAPEELAKRRKEMHLTAARLYLQRHMPVEAGRQAAAAFRQARPLGYKQRLLWVYSRPFDWADPSRRVGP